MAGSDFVILRWFKGTPTNQDYSVSDVTDTSKRTGPLPVTVSSVATGMTSHAGSGQVSVPTATSTVLLDAAAAGTVARRCLIKFPDGVAWRVALGGAAGATSFPVAAGAYYASSSLEDIRGYQASGGTVTVDVIVEAR